MDGLVNIIPYSLLYAFSYLSQEKVKLKYKLTYNYGGTPVTEVGDVANFPL